jgi:phycoerythrin-associated linker protein
MVSTFISPVIGSGARLGLGLHEDTEPVQLYPNDSVGAVEIVIRAVYRQVLGNAYVMESERLTVPESKLTEGRISVREFVRQVAQSELYKSRFFDNCPRYRSIELNFKHLLGRAPDSYDETNSHSQILDRGGYVAEINSYLDSDEYQNKFGENIVPYYCGYKTQTGKNIVGFTHLFQLLRGASSSDKKLTTQDQPRLTSSLIKNRPSVVIPPSDNHSYGGVTDINKLLTNVLNLQEQKLTVAPKAPVNDFTSFPKTNYSTESVSASVNYSQKIAELRQKLSSLSSFATIGAAEIRKWQSTGISEGDSDSGGLASPHRTSINNSQSSNSTEQQTIVDLELQIADAQRLASIGEARLNKWRKRAFF